MQSFVFSVADGMTGTGCLVVCQRGNHWRGVVKTAPHLSLYKACQQQRHHSANCPLLYARAQKLARSLKWQQAVPLLVLPTGVPHPNFVAPLFSFRFPFPRWMTIQHNQCLSYMEPSFSHAPQLTSSHTCSPAVVCYILHICQPSHGRQNRHGVCMALEYCAPILKRHISCYRTIPKAIAKRQRDVLPTCASSSVKYSAKYTTACRAV